MAANRAPWTMIVQPEACFTKEAKSRSSSIYWEAKEVDVIRVEI
jgi:hypothetical protein